MERGREKGKYRFSWGRGAGWATNVGWFYEGFVRRCVYFVGERRGKICGNCVLVILELGN